MNNTTDNYGMWLVCHDKPEFKLAQKVWDDIHNNDTLTYNTFEEYFFHEIYNKELNKDEETN